jgi:uncharacterized protein DUF5947
MDRRDPEEFAALRALLKKKPPAPPGEQCDFCAIPLGGAHGHLIDLQARRILCACRPCYLVMEPAGAARGRYKAVPTRYVEIEALALGDADWEALQIPISLAFFFSNSVEEKMVAFYPGPAGATESLLPLETWSAIAARDPVLGTLAPDVEAVLIHRRNEGTRAFIVPIDAAYELVGLIRTSWRGFAGGEEAWRRIDAFFETLRARAAGRVTEPVR